MSEKNYTTSWLHRASTKSSTLISNWCTQNVEKRRVIKTF